jgi:hypothetical protein
MYCGQICNLKAYSIRQITSFKFNSGRYITFHTDSKSLKIQDFPPLSYTAALSNLYLAVSDLTADVMRSCAVTKNSSN